MNLLLRSVSDGKILFNILLIVSLSSSCFITNCPPGGKRSSPVKKHKCQECGPFGSGECYGPGICCGPFGCLVGGPDTLICQKENAVMLTTPCENSGSYCYAVESGKCAYNGVCCNSELCTVDENCINLPILPGHPNLKLRDNVEKQIFEEIAILQQENGNESGGGSGFEEKDRIKSRKIHSHSHSALPQLMQMQMNSNSNNDLLEQNTNAARRIPHSYKKTSLDSPLAPDQTNSNFKSRGRDKDDLFVYY